MFGIFDFYGKKTVQNSLIIFTAKYKMYKYS